MAAEDRYAQRRSDLVDSRSPWYEVILRWGSISFTVGVLIPILGLMPGLDATDGWKTESGLVYLFVLSYLFVTGAAGFVGALVTEVRRGRPSVKTRRNILYGLIALNFFAGPVYYFGYAMWRGRDSFKRR